jgi:hypothetical protein
MASAVVVAAAVVMSVVVVVAASATSYCGRVVAGFVAIINLPLPHRLYGSFRLQARAIAAR